MKDVGADGNTNGNREKLGGSGRHSLSNSSCLRLRVQNRRVFVTQYSPPFGLSSFSSCLTACDVGGRPVGDYKPEEDNGDSSKKNGRGASSASITVSKVPSCCPANERMHSSLLILALCVWKKCSTRSLREKRVGP